MKLAICLCLVFLASPALADRVRILATDRQAAEARVEMALAAREEILASAFIFGDDPFTLTSLGLLRDAARRGVRVQLIVDAGLARESGVIESPYLVPSRAFQEALDEALHRGVHVRILTNSLGATDNLWPQAGYVGHKKDLVQSGVELWEYQGPECLHAKAAVIDGETVIVGSYNLDPRSENLNTELALVVRDHPLATEMRTLMDGHLKKSARIDARGYPEGAAEPYPGVPRGKVWKLRLLRLLAPVVRGQL